MRTFVACLFASLLVATCRADWPEFRGPTGDGHVAADDARSGLPLEWSETKNVRWKTAIPHRGWSTPVVMDGQIWLTTATEDGHDYFVLCLDAETGQVLHNKQLFHKEEPEPQGNPINSYASCSPAIEPGRVYVHFGSVGTACLDTSTGEVIWQRDDLSCRHYRGASSSVVLFENLVILTLDGADFQYVVALDKATGKTAWKTDRDVEWNDENITEGEYAKYADLAKDGDFRKAHSTPLVVTADGKLQLLSGGAKAMFSYDPRTGKEYWHVLYDDWSVAPRPLYEDGMAYIVTGLMHPELWAVKAGGSGDVTDSLVDWRLKTGVSKSASPLLIDGLIYMVNDDGIASCVEAATGDVVWKKRIGGRHWASPIYAAGRIYFFDDKGQTVVLKPGREFEELATNTLDDGFMASPAVDEGALFLRTKSHLYRIDDAGPN
jgi:outer membrane protein assembly factor BamB